MKYVCRAIILAAFLLPRVSGDAWAQAEPQVRLTVVAINNTANGTPVAGDEVTLQLYQHEQPSSTRQATVGEDGKAVFEAVPNGQHMAAVARVKHQNMTFSGPPVFLKPTDNELSTTVSVFDVSTDTTSLSVGTHHMMIAVRGTSLEFTEYLQLKNTSDMAVVGPERDAQNRPMVIEVMLPRGFKDLTASSYLERNSLVVTPDGFYDTLATPPGEHQVTFSYKIDIDRNTVEVAKEISLPTSELMIFWEQGQGKLEGLGEPESRLANAQGVPIEYYRRAGLKPGDKIAFRVSGFNVKSSDRHTWVILGGAFVVVLVVALLRLRSRPAPGEGRP